MKLLGQQSAPMAAKALMIIIVSGPRKQEEEREESQPFKKLDWADWHRTRAKMRIQRNRAIGNRTLKLAAAPFFFTPGTTIAT